MSLFKVLRGLDENLDKQPLRDGYAYFLKQKNYFVIDFDDGTGTIKRKKVSAEYADKLRYVQDGETIELDAADIATRAYVDTKVSSLEIVPKLTDDGVLYFATNLLVPAEEVLF